MLNFIFLGCHHDDIELGAGILTQRALAANDSVFWIVLTDDASGEDRHRETLAAGAELGVSPDRIHFAGLPDGDLKADRATVGLLRALDLHPDVVVTHTAADSHNDHRAANELAFSTFREAIVLQFPVHISARFTEFSPRFFIARSEEHLAHKRRALESHATQRERIAKRDRSQFEITLGALAGLSSAEAFELSVQVGGERAPQRADDAQRRPVPFALVSPNRRPNDHPSVRGLPRPAALNRGVLSPTRERRP